MKNYMTKVVNYVNVITKAMNGIIKIIIAIVNKQSGILYDISKLGELSNV